MIHYRPIENEDRSSITDIAKGTWEGEDYLPEVFDRWINEGNFYGIDMDGIIIATGKITILPCKVGWLEGLRVHKDFRGKGLGRKMHDFLINRAMEMRKAGKIRFIEFSTYFRNNASITMGLKDNFKITKRFFGFNLEAKSPEKPEVAKVNSLTELKYKEYVPCGWKFLRICKDTLNFIKEHCQVYEYSNVKFFHPKTEPWEITPLQYDVKSILKLIPALSYFSNKNEISIKIPEETGYKEYIKNGFKKWEDVMNAEVLVLSKL